MSIDNYAVERLEDTLDEIEELADDQIEIEEAVEKARGYLRDIENSDDDDDLLELDPDDLPSADVQDFKTRVLDAIPSGASMKFRMDVEEMLEKFKGVY
jgi:hypothetical protein